MNRHNGSKLIIHSRRLVTLKLLGADALPDLCPRRVMVTGPPVTALRTSARFCRASRYRLTVRINTPQLYMFIVQQT